MSRKRWKQFPFMGGLRDMERDENGLFVSKKGKKTVISKIARAILEQPEHVEELAAQARNGVGPAPDQLPPATHRLLCEYAYGAPVRETGDRDLEVERLKAFREAANRMLLENPDQATVINVSAMRAAALPVHAELPEQPKKDNGDAEPAA